MAALLWLGAAVFLAVPLRVRAEPVARTVQADRVARLIARGEACRAAGDVISALGLFRDAISAAPRKSEGYVALGELYLALEEPQRALEVFETGTRAAASDEALWLGLSASLSKLGQHGRALDALRRLHSLSPTPRGLRALAEAAETRGAFVEALAARRGLVAQLVRLTAGPAADTAGDTAAGADTRDADDARAALKLERAHVRALELLLGAADPVRAQAACSDPRTGLVQRALSRCP